MTLADICLFPYTHVAPEAGFEMHLYPRVRDWLERVKGQPHYISDHASDAALPRRRPGGYIAANAGRSVRGGHIHL